MYKVQISNNNETLSQIIELRYDVLRKPWRQSKDTASDNLEHEAINAFIEVNGKFVACGRLQNNGNGMGQIRYMAVHGDFQGKGLGKLIIEELEKQAHILGLNKIELQARENAVEFYESCGYAIKDKTFKLWDIIQHFLMVKDI